MSSPSTDPSAQGEEFVVGLMSGTSTDGVDAALVSVHGEWPNPRITLHRWLARDYSPQTRETLMGLYPPHQIRIEDLSRLNMELGEFYAATVLQLLDEAQVPAEQVLGIGSRGVTIGHFPPVEGQPQGHRIEIAEASVIAERTGINVVSDYGIRDQAAGGHGVLGGTAFVDYVLFHSADRGYAIQNIGGIGNVTYVRPGGTLDDVLAFDTGPGNMLIDFAAVAATDGAQAYDRDGLLARKGSVCQPLVDELLGHGYFDRRPPKSTGRELFGLEMWRDISTRAAQRGLTDIDVVATMTAFTAQSILSSYRSYVFPLGPVDEVVVGGGGAYNPVILESLQELLDPVPVVTHDEHGIPAAIREAVTWGVLAAANLHGRPTSLPRVTGARHPVVYGKFSPGSFNWGSVPFKAAR